nr:hypothetical protein CFP56_25625 [Quercus suber]
MADLTSRSFLLSLATTITAVVFSSRDIGLSLVDLSLSHGVVSNRFGDFVERLEWKKVDLKENFYGSGYLFWESELAALLRDLQNLKPTADTMSTQNCGL